MTLRRVAQLTLALMIGSLLLAVGTTAGATVNPDYTEAPPETPVTTPPPAARSTGGATSARPAVPARPVRSTLAITGSDLTQVAVIGGVLLAGGVAVLTVRRRQPLTA